MKFEGRGSVSVYLALAFLYYVWYLRLEGIAMSASLPYVDSSPKKVVSIGLTLLSVSNNLMSVVYFNFTLNSI